MENPVLIVYKATEPPFWDHYYAGFLKLIQWSGTVVGKVIEIDLQLKNMWILWINIISTLVADMMVLSIILEIQQQILKWLMGDRIPWLKQTVKA